MATISIITVLLVVVVSLLAIEVQAQNNRDIRLVNNWRNNLGTFRGQLEVFIDGKWGTMILWYKWYRITGCSKHCLSIAGIKRIIGSI